MTTTMSTPTPAATSTDAMLTPKSAAKLASEPSDSWPCSADGCPRPARYAITFHGQPGHVHDCDPCTAVVREWCDVATVVALPCPHPHGSAGWTDQPRPLAAPPWPDEPPTDPIEAP